MKHDLNRLSLAVRLALCAGIFSVAGAAQAQATTPDNPQSTDQTAPPSKKDAKTLQSVVVTGSLIKRVDVETASPVVTLDRSTLTNSGKPVLGDVLQQLPSIRATPPTRRTTATAAAWPAPCSRPVMALRAFRCAAWGSIARWCWWTASACPTRTST